MPPNVTDTLPLGPVPTYKVISPDVRYTDTHILADYTYHNATVSKNEIDGTLEVIPTETKYKFKTEVNIPKVG